MFRRLRDYLIPHIENNFLPNSVKEASMFAITSLAVLVVAITLFGSTVINTTSWMAQVRAALLAQITNSDRVENNVGELVINPVLEEAARLKAEDMITHQYFAHTSPEGKTPWHWFQQVGYDYQFAGENLAIDFYDTQQVADAWMESPLHRKNILNAKYTEIGIAVESGVYEGRPVTFVVQMFGTPRYEPAPSTTPQEITIATDLEGTGTIGTAEGIILGEQIDEEEYYKEEAEADVGPIVVAQNTIEPVVTNTPQPEPEDDVIIDDTGNQKNNKDVFSLPEDEVHEPIKETQSYVETSVQGDESEVVQETDFANDIKHQTPRITFAQKMVLNPGFSGRILLFALTAFVALVLLLKIFIEIKKQHYRHVLLALLVITMLVVMNVVLLRLLDRVVIA